MHFVGTTKQIFKIVRSRHKETTKKKVKMKAFLFSVYVDFSTDSTPIQVSIRVDPTVSVNRNWNIKLSQIECTSTERGWNLNFET